MRTYDKGNAVWLQMPEPPGNVQNHPNVRANGLAELGIDVCSNCWTTPSVCQCPEPAKKTMLIFEPVRGLNQTLLDTLIENAAEPTGVDPVAPVQPSVEPNSAPVEITPVEPVPVALPNFLQIARRITDWGGHVVRVNRLSKSCTMPGWQNLATRDMQVLKAWAEVDEHSNVGLVGKEDGLWGFDSDDPSLLPEYEDNYGVIPTPRVRTVSGGTHLYFKSSPASSRMGNLSVKKPDGKTELWSARVLNKYAVGVGSVAHPENDVSLPLQEYKLVEGFDYEPIEAPETFLNFLIAKASASEKVEKVAGTQTIKATGQAVDHDIHGINHASILKGGRNLALTSLAGSARDLFRLDESELSRYLERVNGQRCQPELPDSEIQTISKSVGKYALAGEVFFQGQPVITDARKEQFITGILIDGNSEPDDSELEDRPQHVDQTKLNDLLAAGQSLQNALLVVAPWFIDLLSAQRKQEEQKIQEITNWRAKFRSVGEMQQGDIIMLIDRFLPEGTCFIGANPGDGKTLIGLAMAKAISTGSPLFNRRDFQVKQARPVIYLIPETGDRAFRTRCEAFRIPNSEMFLTRTISMGASLQLSDPGLLEAVRQTKPVVFLDTASRFMQSSDENSSAQNRQLVDDVLELLAAGAVCVVILHHATKASKREAMDLQNMLRGTSDLGAMCDTAYGIRKDVGLYNNGAGPLEIDIENIKPRDLVNPPEPFRLAGTYKKQGVPLPISCINETGNFLVVGANNADQHALELLFRLVETHPQMNIGDLAEETGLKKYTVAEQLKRLNWHKIRGGSNGSPWHKDIQGVCPFGKPDKDDQPIDGPRDIDRKRQRALDWLEQAVNEGHGRICRREAFRRGQLAGHTETNIERAQKRLDLRTIQLDGVSWWSNEQPEKVAIAGEPDMAA